MSSATLGMLVIVVLCTWACYAVAKRQQANVPFWVLMGACFGPFAVPFVFLARPRKTSQV